MNLIEQFKALKRGDNLILKINNEEAVKEIAYLALKNDSYESLFKSAIANNDSISPSFDLEKFLTLYTENYALFKQKMQIIVYVLIGEECYEFINSKNIQWEINYNLSIVTFYYQ